MSHGLTVRDSIGPRTSPLAQASVVVSTITEIDGVPIQDLDEIVVRILLSQQTTSGGAGVVDFYLQRPVKGTGVPDPTVDADWDDFASFTQLPAATAKDESIRLPLVGPQDVDGSLAAYPRVRAIGTLASATILHGRWGDAIRFVEKIGGADLTQAAIYTVHLTGIRNPR